MAASLDHFRLLARYNGLANERLYAACAGLDDAERRRDRGAFFRSIHGTLNHILLGDRIWLARFAGGTAPSTGLDAELYADFAELARARRDEDRRIAAFVDGLDGRALARSVRYVNNEGRELTDPMPLLLAHVFNHQTHHRGQVHDMLCQAGHRGLVLDLHRVIAP